jgi:hypothetical protein
LQAAFLLHCLVALVVALSSPVVQAQNCAVSAPEETVASRQIQLNISCADAPFFKLSESSDFQETSQTGVVVSLDSIDPQGEYADISVLYPNGTAGSNAIPFSVTSPARQVRILAVLFNFAEGALVQPSYATPNWVHKLIFDGDHDGRSLANSLKTHIEQNTYGSVTLSGEVYPYWVQVASIETYRDLNLSPTPDRKFAEDIVQYLIDNDSEFFAGKDFDFLIAVTPGRRLGNLRSSHYKRFPVIRYDIR